MKEYHRIMTDYAKYEIHDDAGCPGNAYQASSLLPSFAPPYNTYTAVKPGDVFLDDFVSEKLGLIKDIIIDIKLQIEERGKVQRKIIDSLDQLICVTRTKLADLVNKHELRTSPDFMRRRSELDKQINQLETQKLAEKLEFWRDVNMLKRDLREALERHRSSLSFQTINSI